MDAMGQADLREVDFLAHGTTVIINALTERKGAKTALPTTKGFRDVLEIQRANRPDLYNLVYAKPRPFVPRRLRLEVTERMSYKGQPLTRLDEESVRSAVPRRNGSGSTPSRFVSSTGTRTTSTSAGPRRSCARSARKLPSPPRTN
jgi:N-methylhydantoinase A